MYSLSLSSRRAWIEIGIKSAFIALSLSRSPRGERGLKYKHNERLLLLLHWSLSSRRAWIEIQYYVSIDYGTLSRSPRGERGLKSVVNQDNIRQFQVALLAESVD